MVSAGGPARGHRVGGDPIRIGVMSLLTPALLYQGALGCRLDTGQPQVGEQVIDRRS